MNELIFIIQTITISLAALGALYLGKEALVTFICVQSILANLFVLKQTTLFGLNATCSDAFAVGATLGLNLLQEYFGKTITRKAIWLNFFFLVFYAIISQVHLAYAPSMYDITQHHFLALLTFMPRIVVASFIVYLIAQTVDYVLYGTLKKIWTHCLLVLRNYGSIMVSQFVDTVLFTFLGLYGIIANLSEVIVISYSIKLMVIAIATPFVAFSHLIYRSQQPKSN